MLLELTVRNIALIKEATVTFREGLNIMTGETGAGKSVIIGSCMLALGGKARPDIIREGADSAGVELVFSVDENNKKAFSDMGIDVSENVLVMSRKFIGGRSISRINGETVNLKALREAAAYLIDIYGQNEYHTLLDPENHLGILDSYLGERIAPERKKVKAAFEEYRKAEKDLQNYDLDEDRKNREIELLEYELSEIDAASLKPEEEEELTEEYKKLNNARKILEFANGAHEVLMQNAAGEALKLVESALRYDPALKDLRDELYDADTILSDASRELSSYIASFDLSEERLAEVEKRLDLIRTLETRFGHTIEDILDARSKKEARLAVLHDYEENRKKAESFLHASGKKLAEACRAISEKRKEGALELCGQVKAELLELGFEAVEIHLLFSEKMPSENGSDRVCFMVALNPGEKPKPISEVASGGELSRVMLSIKTVLAGTDRIPTLIFDEIDAGISGRTAQKVAEKLSIIGTNHQVICITHLPQIASMADAHYRISKKEEDGRNVTEIHELTSEESVGELGRLLGGLEITENVLKNAAEMKALADRKKSEKRREICG